MGQELAGLLSVSEGRRSLERLLQPLLEQPELQRQPLGCFTVGGRSYSVPWFTFAGPNSSEPLRIGLFGALHGDEPAGALAVVRFLQDLAKTPQVAEGFQVSAYPVCNPTGFEDNTRHSRRGKDLNREFWNGSVEAEVQILEQELLLQHFNGIVQLHADDTSPGIYGFVRGHTLTENLLRPALCAAGAVLPRNVNATIDGFAARDGIIYEHYRGVLAAPANLQPAPFEIILETPLLAPIELQVEALVVAIRTILAEYRRLMAFAPNL